ncbi:hypothetical protein MBEHAL_1994 [Halarchaeum acidiphilum MH1-52-1]|uniref:Uncharacterized protein n=1 Tax=Halarchaeum acidiphilum MH1-52-1 TaxID=1261545 RepID=U3A6E4_9EURY|nr:hypothetical protein MBEHAL_1994 [Halarchaeum acidiphilum MH1-52-1]
MSTTKQKKRGRSTRSGADDPGSRRCAGRTPFANAIASQRRGAARTVPVSENCRCSETRDTPHVAIKRPNAPESVWLRRRPFGNGRCGIVNLREPVASPSLGAATLVVQILNGIRSSHSIRQNCMGVAGL